ncbi:excinuclease ABC subunit UvrC [Helicobacter sp. 11S02629-2]|uniref:excinuclease ABC subunit UvrC n=1 Tax=Helicobacter sp. 11S02629-2 TaxID=1476195 RepID=UPI000BD4AE66|nr:excinuclease ABC subunit UvrC [Helicobacter sp. 11S02629-2]PAF44124.1 excinuclease ABC subunit C [Helicobacter sp. 11S02629-2]
MSLLEDVKDLPTLPGIYQYFDVHNALLYVGKAKNLKSRVKSYFILNVEKNALLPNPANSLRIQKMIKEAHSLRYTIVDSEQEALILENSFIKSQNPKYNILLRDDKTYPYIMLDMGACYPRPVITRKMDKKKNVFYFGPFTKGASFVLNALYTLLPLVQNASCAKGKNVCLYYQLNKCLGVCEFGKEKEYKVLADKTLEYLQNPHRLKQALKSYMLACSKKLLYEEAGACKHAYEVLDDVRLYSKLDSKHKQNLDILGFESDEKYGILFKLFMREGRVISSDKLVFKARNEDKVAVYKQAILNLKHVDNFANEIVLANLEESEFESLSEDLSGLNLTLTSPKKGFKKALCELACSNAKNTLLNKTSKTELALNEIATLLDSKRIEKVEVFDTSHHAGTYCVGAKVAFVGEDFDTSSYRRYKLEGKDEISQTTEMLTRRAHSFKTDFPPDLWVLDGGAVQLKIAKKAIESIGANVALLSISKEKRDAKAYRAKGGAKDILRYFSKDSDHILELRLDVKNPMLQFLQKLRDEAHRFAITFHRERKVKGLTGAKGVRGE